MTPRLSQNDETAKLIDAVREALKLILPNKPAPEPPPPPTDKEIALQPQWWHQARSVENGEKTWDDFTIEQKTCHGWLRPSLWQLDALIGSGRWNYLINAIHAKQIPEAPIPRIGFTNTPNKEAMAMLDKCMSSYRTHNVSLTDFFNWILWGFGAIGKRPSISDEANEFLYGTFNLDLLLLHPHDYVGELMVLAKSGAWSNPNKFFPTPHPVCEAMVKISMHDIDKEPGDPRLKSVCDPTGGSGRMLLHASNYSLNLYYQDIDPLCVAAMKINGYLYVPWMIYRMPGVPVVSGGDKPKKHKRKED